MSSQTFRLWGFDGELRGNEERLQARLPMFTREGSDEVYLAKKLDWSPKLPQSDVVRMNTERAEEVGERLDLTARELPVHPSRYVVIAGPLFQRYVAGLGISWWGIILAQSGVAVQMMPAEDFDLLAQVVHGHAMGQFDASIAAGTVTDRTRLVLTVMRNVGIDNVRAQLVRTLALHFLAGETDHFLRVLRLGAARLQESPERLKKEMQEYLDFVRTSPAVARRHRTGSAIIVKSRPVQLLRKVAVVLAMSSGREDGKASMKEKIFNGTLSDLGVAPRVDSKKLTDWIVNEKQAE
ncbi:MAG TPA: hypothetical protein VEK57_13145 [Thermoanaerobaculia bacterium]|nr:hypothetical protein [Thermoanaerobaculia bacterium]